MKNFKNIIAKLREPNVLRVIIIATVVILLLAGFVIYEKMTDRVFVDDSLIQAPIISIAPDTQGKILDVKVYDGQTVKKGDAVATVGTKTLNAYENGLIVSTNRTIGSIANPQVAVVQMINFSDMRVAGTLDETKGVDQVKVGQPVSFTVDALPGQSFWGFVDEVSPTAKQTQLQFSVSSERPTQQFIIYARFNAYQYPQILNGMSAKMTIYTNTP